MKITEFTNTPSTPVAEKFNIEDAVSLHDTLNPKIWVKGKMRPEVRTALLDIADNFKSFLGIDDIEVKDITISGSNAAYSYTNHSDLDLHLIVDVSKLDDSDIYRELFDSKKYQYNDLHNINIRGIEVELYVQNANDPVVSLGQFSVKNNKWIQTPERRAFTINDAEVKDKYNDLRSRALRALRGNNEMRVNAVLDDIKRARRSGLAAGGEFSPENLAFKMLRTQGVIQKLWDAKAAYDDKKLSLEAKQIAEDVQLNEINMSPSNLSKLVSQIDARAGMEFEMIVPNLEGDEDEGDLEQDYDMDERVRSISDAVEFFHDGDYNGRREVQRLQERMESDFFDWQGEQLSEGWGEEGPALLREYIENNDWDEDSAMEEALEEIKNANPELTDSTPEFDKLVNNRVSEMLDEKVSESWQDQDYNYDSAKEEYEDSMRDDFDDGAWLEHEGIERMSDVESNYDIQWPHWTSAGHGGGEQQAEDVAMNFQDAIGRDVNFSSGYHGAKREEGKYVVEPDGSLSGDNSGDSGLEFVSPPLPVADLLSDLKKVKAWADKTGCYTNDSTGLHINISVPNYSLEKLDYVKLAMLMGDEYILQQFGREANTYCKSATKFIKEKATPETIEVIMKKMKEQLNTSVSKLIHSGITNKFTSINTKDGYVEFRSPGGDWLGENFDKIENTLLRLVVALDAAIDETKYKDEYAKKLYKLIAPSDDKTNTMQYFAKFSAGELPRSALMSFVKQAQLQRSNKKQQQKPEQAAPQQAQDRAATSQGNWGIWIDGSQRFARMPNSIVTDNVLRRFPSREAAEQFLSQTRQDTVGMRTDIQAREIPADYQLPDTPAGRPVQQPAEQPAEQPVPGSTVDLQRQRAERLRAAVQASEQPQWTGWWKVIDGGTGSELYRFNNIGNSQADANNVARRWIQSQGITTGAIEVVPEMA